MPCYRARAVPRHCSYGCKRQTPLACYLSSPLFVVLPGGQTAWPAVPSMGGYVLLVRKETLLMRYRNRSSLVAAMLVAAGLMTTLLWPGVTQFTTAPHAVAADTPLLPA